MQTITIEQLKQNAGILSANFSNEAFFLTNDQNQIFLVSPITQNGWQELAEQYFALNPNEINRIEKRQITDMQIDNLRYEYTHDKHVKRKPQSFDEFDKQWCGFMKDVQVPDNWRDEYINDKMKKHE